jgi:outer membrane protein assembly factor BamD (BamD/ComL family)
VQLGSVYLASGDEKKATKLYEKSIDKLTSGNRTEVIQLANAFISEREFKYAEQTYLKGRELSRGEYSYGFELANIYYYSRDYQKMINQYLNVLEESPRYLKTVQNRLQSTVYRQDDGSLNDILKTELIRRIQKSKNNSIFSELLIWLYLQEKRFDKAYFQTKALVKRNKEDGQRLIELGKLAYNNKDYTTASKCFQFVMDLGEQNINYLTAKVAYLQTEQAEVLSNPRVTDEQVSNLLETYRTFLNTMGNATESIELSINYAHVLAFYGDDAPLAISILEQLEETRALNQVQKSKTKMEMADVLLLNDDIWEATLYYSQVIKANPNNEIGNEAQIMKAKLAYYSGDFLWAKGQLDVLKASTSKLIANDAFYLSSIISDNLEDTIEKPLQLFARADLLIFQNKNKIALSVLDSLQKSYPNHSLADDVLFKKAEVNVSLGNDTVAKQLFQEIIDNYYSDILADNAIMALANLYLKEDNPEKAMELYTQLLVDFPDSFFTTEARRRIVEYRDS